MTLHSSIDLGAVRPVAVVDVVRTGIRKSFKSQYAPRRPDSMVASCANVLADRYSSLVTRGVDDFIVGCALPEGAQGLNIGRNAVAASKLPPEVPGQTVNRYCGSGLQAVVNAGACIASGWADVVFSGGTESVSMVMPFANTTHMYNPVIAANLPTLYTNLFDEEETRPFVKRAGLNMVSYAESTARMLSISREAQDDHSFLVLERALAAKARGVFAEEIIPGQADSPEIDEFLLRASKRADFQRFSPVLSDGGTVTARNSAPLAEGASLSLLASRTLVKDYELTPLGYLLGHAVCAVEPSSMGLGASTAIRKLLNRTGLDLDDIDLFEINEPFASIGLATLDLLGLHRERVNLNGSALALGHPYGMSGTRIVGALLRELERIDGRLGIAAACIGGGMGIAALFQR